MVWRQVRPFGDALLDGRYHCVLAAAARWGLIAHCLCVWGGECVHGSFACDALLNGGDHRVLAAAAALGSV